MIADVILGKNIDTENWIFELQKGLANNIFVVDYDYHDKPEECIEGIIYVSPKDALKLLQNFDSINFYKSLYVLPGMGGQMSSLFK